MGNALCSGVENFSKITRKKGKKNKGVSNNNNKTEMVFQDENLNNELNKLEHSFKDLSEKSEANEVIKKVELEEVNEEKKEIKIHEGTGEIKPDKCKVKEPENVILDKEMKEMLKDCEDLDDFIEKELQFNSFSKYQSDRTIELRFFGDRKVGKSSLIYTYLYGKFVKKFRLPADLWTKKFSFIYQDNPSTVQITLSLKEGILTPSSIKDVIFFLCYAINDERSFNRITQKWIPSLKKKYSNFEKNAILIGTKKDLNEKRKVDSTMGEKVREKLQLGGFYELSAKINEEVEEIIKDCVICFIGNNFKEFNTVNTDI